MMDQQQEARTLTLGERMVLAARLAVEEHLRQSIKVVPTQKREATFDQSITALVGAA